MSATPFWRVLWKVNNSPSADLYTPARGIARRIAQAISDIHDARMVLVPTLTSEPPEDYGKPLRNPTLVHHGFAQGASYHLLTQAGAPLADFYFGEALARKAAKAIADEMGIVLELSENDYAGRHGITYPGHKSPVGAGHVVTEIGEGLRLPGKPKRNPAGHPVVGEVWHTLAGGKCKVIEVAGSRVRVLHMETGNREWIDRGDFLAHYFPSGRTRSNPKRKGRGRPLSRASTRSRGNGVKRSAASGRGRSRANPSIPTPLYDALELEQAIEDGFLDPKQWKRSAIEYAVDNGLLEGAVRERRTARRLAKSKARKNPRGGPRIVYNKLLGGWYVVTGPHQTPLNGRFNSKAEAQAWLAGGVAGRRANPKGRIHWHEAPRPLGELARTRVDYEGGRFLTGAVVGMSADEKKAISDYLVRIGHWTAFEPGTVEWRIETAARELAATKGGQITSGQGRYWTKPKSNPVGNAFKVGQRVQLHAATDEWMQGDRYGVVVGFGRTREYTDRFSPGGTIKARPVRVKLDKSGRVRRFHPDNLFPIEDNPNPKGRNPRTQYGGGVYVNVTMTKREVMAFKSRWPASGLPDKAITFVFDTRNGDLVGHTLNLDSAEGSGALPALAQDAWEAAKVKRNRRQNRRAGKARSNPRESEVARARRTYQLLNENEPGQITRVRGARNAPKVAVKIGELVSLVYRSDKYAGSPDNPEGKPQLYEHKTKRPHPVLVTDSEGREVHIVGGKMHPTPDGLVN
jgi:hypothetical protein